MSVSQIITAPTAGCASSVVMTLARTIARTTSPYTLEEQVFKWPGEQWIIEFNLPPFKNEAVAKQWVAFGVKLQGGFNRFLMGDPSSPNPRGVATGTPVVNGAGQSGNILSTSGWTPSTNGIMRAGDYIQLGSGAGAKLHMVVTDANSNGSGVASLEIEPALRVPPQAGSAVVVRNAKGVFRLVDNNFSWSVTPGKLYRVSFTAEEVVGA